MFHKIIATRRYVFRTNARCLYFGVTFMPVFFPIPIRRCCVAFNYDYYACYRHGGHPHEHPQPVIGQMVTARTSAESEAEGFKTTPVFKEIQAAMKAVRKIEVLFLDVE